MNPPWEFEYGDRIEQMFDARPTDLHPVWRIGVFLRYHRSIGVAIVAIDEFQWRGLDMGHPYESSAEVWRIRPAPAVDRVAWALRDDSQDKKASE